MAIKGGLVRIHISYAPARKKPKAGDEKIIKGVLHVRQQQYSNLYGAYVVSNGRPVYEWVPKVNQQPAGQESE